MNFGIKYYKVGYLTGNFNRIQVNSERQMRNVIMHIQLVGKLYGNILDEVGTSVSIVFVFMLYHWTIKPRFIFKHVGVKQDF